MSSPPLWTSIGFAFKGIVNLVKTQRNARIHLGFTLAVLLAGLCFQISRLEWMAVILSIGGVWMAESFNTALEILADTLHPQHHNGIGRAKDLAAAAVLLFVFVAVLVGIFVFLPHFQKLLGW